MIADRLLISALCHRAPHIPQVRMPALLAAVGAWTRPRGPHARTGTVVGRLPQTVTDRMLADIGLTRGEHHRLAARPGFWL